MDIIKFSDCFYKMEKDLCLFESSVDGVSWWDVVRHDVFYHIYYGLNNSDINLSPTKSVLQLAMSGLRYFSKRVCLYLTRKLFKHDVLVLSAPRNYRNGKLNDIILCEILENVPFRKLIIETVPVYYHISLKKKRSKKISQLQYTGLNDEVRKRFGQNFDVENFIDDRLQKFNFSVAEYTKLLEQVKPKFIILVQNGIEKALFHAANMKNIPTVEAQHGFIGYVHPAYNYPKEIEKGSLSTLPTFFLSLSRHWTTNCYYPVMRSIVCGNSSLNLRRTSHSNTSVLVISAPPYEEPLENLLMPAAKELIEVKFVYKLHPSQYTRKNEILKRFLGFKNVEVVCGEKTISQLTTECSSALCVQSTAVYEILQAGLLLYLLKVLDYKTHADIFDHTNCKLVSTTDTFVSFMKETKTSNSEELPVYFETFKSANVTDLVDILSK